MNLLARQNFGRKSSPAYNTEIGGVSGTITTASALATTLGISVGNISNFTIVGSDIKCKITGSYGIPLGAFNTFGGNFPNVLTYYYDYDNLVTSISRDSFATQTNFIDFKLNGVTILNDYQSFYANSAMKVFYLPNLATISQFDNFKNCTSSEIIYIPLCTTIGASHSVNNGNFSVIKTGTKIYAHPSMATINSGGVEADLAAAIAAGNIVRYVTNFTAPNPVTTLAAGTIYNTAIQLNFTAPTGSTNAIEFYELYNNGVFVKNITASGQYVTGLTPSTSYNITLIAVDIFYNKSVVSNSLSVTTNTTSAVPTTGLVSYYKLDETSAGVAVDSQGGYNLTNTGVTINQSGKVGTSYQATGAIQKLQNSSYASITGNFSMNLWVYITAAQTIYSTPLEVGNYAANTGFGFLWDGQILAWRIKQLYNNYSTLMYVPLNIWTMITIVYNGTDVKMYLNGVLKNIKANTTNPTASNLITAFYRQDQAQQMTGKDDEMAVYNIALTQNQIDILYNSGNGTTL